MPIYYPLVHDALYLDHAEGVALRQNGFVVSDRLAFRDLATAYAYIYWKDLPVLITTDSLLHALHKTQDELVQRLEVVALAPS